MPQSFGSLHCHIVFSTKQRRPYINDDVQPRLFAYIGGIVGNHSSSLIAAGGMPDHVHLLVSLGRTLAVADGVRLIKSNSSAWLHDEVGMAGFQWQEGYGAFAVSYSHIDLVKSYLADQRQHHHRATLQDEFRQLLRRHNIEWDERYVWD
ncbi:MAG: IS200/IS605 family transposase [Pirellulales bacterium]